VRAGIYWRAAPAFEKRPDLKKFSLPAASYPRLSVRAARQPIP
jgi:hypothetical protein